EIHIKIDESASLELEVPSGIVPTFFGTQPPPYTGNEQVSTLYTNDFYKEWVTDPSGTYPCKEDYWTPSSTGCYLIPDCLTRPVPSGEGRGTVSIQGTSIDGERSTIYTTVICSGQPFTCEWKVSYLGESNNEVEIGSPIIQSIINIERSQTSTSDQLYKTPLLPGCAQ